MTRNGSETQIIFVARLKKKLWLLRRMKGLNLSTMQIFDVYVKEVRSILEMAVPVWHGGLTQKQSKEIERVQKVAFRIILTNNYRNYDNALKTLDTETLYPRRINICKSFVTKNMKSEYHNARAKNENCMRIQVQQNQAYLFQPTC